MFLTIQQVASRWQVNPESVRRLVRAKALKSTRPVGRAIRIPVEAVEAREKARTK